MDQELNQEFNQENNQDFDDHYSQRDIDGLSSKEEHDALAVCDWDSIKDEDIEADVSDYELPE
jgi:hypothetical protein